MPGERAVLRREPTRLTLRYIPGLTGAELRRQGRVAGGDAQACPLLGTLACSSPTPGVALNTDLSLTHLPRPKQQSVSRDQTTPATWFASKRGPCWRGPADRRPSPEPPGGTNTPAAVKRARARQGARSHMHSFRSHTRAHTRTPPTCAHAHAHACGPGLC